MPMAFSSMKAKYRSTHNFLSGSGPSSYKRVMLSLVVVEELDFCVFGQRNKKKVRKKKNLSKNLTPQRFSEIIKIFTLDLDSGLGVTPPSTLLFILLFISGLGAIPTTR